MPEEDTDVTEADGKAHYVRVKALLAGGAVVALCGKKYVPTIIAEAEAQGICPECKDLYAMLEMMHM